MSLLARPGQTLIDHLLQTRVKTDEIWEQLNITGTFMGRGEFTKQQLQTVSAIIALTHDIGKCTNYFQRSLANLPTENTYHTQLSSIIAFYETLACIDTTDMEAKQALAYISAMIVRKHHQGLMRLECDWEYSYDEIMMMRYQLQDIDPVELGMLNDSLQLPIPLDVNTLDLWVDKIQRDIHNAMLATSLKRFVDSATLEYWDVNFIPKLLFSILIQSDSLDANHRKHIPSRVDDITIDDMFLVKLCNIRQQQAQTTSYLPRIIYLVPILTELRQTKQLTIDDGRARSWNAEIIITTPTVFNGVLFPQSKNEYYKIWPIVGSIIVTNGLFIIDWVKDYLQTKFNCVVKEAV